MQCRKLFADKLEGEYPYMKEIYESIQKWQRIWNEINEDNKVIRRITEIIGITHPRDIEAFIIGGGLKVMSHPLILPVTSTRGVGSRKQIELILHEILHVIIGNSQENKDLKKYWNEVGEKYPEESKTTQNHIIIYAVLTKLLAEIIPDTDIKDLISADWTDYHRALEIAREEGPDEVIVEFRRLVNEK